MYKELFKMPKPTTIKGRTSSITNSFINGIIPCIVPTEDEIKEMLSVIGMDEKTTCCAYCGDKMTEWDHFRPLIVNQQATGYISEIHNLVPACGKCNQSKGNKNWKDWMLSNAQQSPKTREINDLDIRIKRLERYEHWGTPTKIDFAAVVGKEMWDSYLNAWQSLLNNMSEAQLISDKIKQLIKAAG